MDVRMPDGTIISNVPEGTTKAQLLAKYQSYAKSQQTELEPPVEKAGLLRRAGDVGLSAVQGAISLPQSFVGLADIPTGGRVGKALEDYAGYKPEEAKQLLQGMKSPQQQAIDAYVGEGDIGFIETGKRALQSPSSIVNMAAQTIPSMLGGAGIARGVLSAAPRIGALRAGIAGEGAISAGATAESIRNQTESGYLTPTQSGVAALSGVLTAGFGALGAKASKFLGVEDIDTLLARGVSEADKGSVLVGAFKGALAESAFEELPQSAQEQAAQNIALGRPWDEGVAEAAALGAISALPFGGVAGGIGRSQANTAVEQQLEADKRKAFEADMQARRQATGVMDQQPLFTPEEAPIPVAPAMEETPEEAIPEPTLTIPEPEVAPDQMALFGPRGGVTPEAKASVALARQQGLPAEIDTLLQTPEGRKQLAGDMKTYFPELTAQERNKTRKEIQQGVFRTPTAPAVEGELTPALLKQFDITPQRFKGFYTALAGANLADPMTYQMLVQAAESGSVRGMRAAELLKAFPQYNPETVQRDLFGGPAYAERTEPEQQDMFGVPQDGVQADVEPAGVERGVEQPVLRGAPEPTAVAEPVGGGLGYAGEPTGGRDVSPEAGQEAQPSALTPEPTVAQPSALTPKELRAQERAIKAAEKARVKESKAAAAQLKAEPIEDAWSEFMTGVDFGSLSPIAQQSIRDARKGNVLNQDFADSIASIEKGNRRTEAANAAVATQEEPLSDTEFAQALPTIKDPTVAQEAKDIRKGTEGKSLVQVMRWMQENAPSKSYRVIARAVGNRIERLSKMGVQFTYSITDEKGTGLKAPLEKGTNGVTQNTFSDTKITSDVRIQGEFSPSQGMNYDTVLHETIHAATSSAVRLANLYRRLGRPDISGISEHVDRLEKVRKLLISEALDRVTKGLPVPNDVKIGLVGLQPTREKKLALAIALGVTQATNTLADVNEIIAWGLTNKEFQTFMDSIEMPNSNKTFWSEFVNVIRSLLGLSAKYNSALAEILTASEGLLESNVGTVVSKNMELMGTKAQQTSQSKVIETIDPNAQAEARQLIKGMSGTIINTPRTPTPSAKEIVANTVTMAVKDPKGLLAVTEDMITRFRAVVADKNASVAAKIMAYRDGAFYDVNGNVREDMALSAEANTGNFIDQFIKDGDIFIDKNGSVQVRASSYSVDNIFSAAKSLSDRIGVQEAKDLITASFYHYRAAAIKAMPKDQWPDNWKRDPRMVPTDAQINAAMDAFNKVPELEYMRKQFIGAKNNVVKFLNQAGFLGDEKTKEFLADDSYAPWMRIKEYQENAPSMGNIGRMVDLGQMKKLVGGTDEVNDMLENMTQMLAWGVRSGIKNHAANGALNVLATMGAAQKHKTRPNGVDPSHVVMTYEGGKPSFWSVDSPSDLGAFLAVKISDNPYMKAIAKAMGTLRAAIVLFPVFPVAQVIMDSQRAYMQSGVEKPVAMVGKIFKAFLSGEAFRAVSEDALTLRRYGVAAQVDYNTHDASRGLAKQYGVSTDKKSITDRFYETSGYQFLHRLAYSADLAVRLGIYQQVVEESGDKTLAANKAREIINFQKSGTSTKIIVAKQLIPFLGAYLQGMDVNYRSMVGQGNSMKNRKAAAAAYWTNLAMYSALVVAYTMANSGDDDYEEQKGYVTDRNFLIPGGFLIPVPPDVGFLAKVIPERITDYIMQEGTDNPESAERLSRGIAEAAAAAYLPPTAVYGLQPYLELKFNKSFFSNMPIVGEYYSKLEPKYQIAPTTSGTATAVGNAINASPIQIDYLFNAIGATTAGSILQLADAVMGTTAIAKDKPALVGRFVQKPIGGRETEEFYAVRDLVDRAYTTYNALGEADKIDELELYISDPRIAARLDLRDTIESIGTALSDLRDERNAIYADKALSDTERRVLIDELNTIQEQMLRDAGIRKMRSEIE